MPTFKHLNQINSKDELAASMGRSFRGFGRSLFNLDISYDDKDPKRYAVHLGHSRIGTKFYAKLYLVFNQLVTDGFFAETPDCHKFSC